VIGVTWSDLLHRFQAGEAEAARPVSKSSQGLADVVMWSGERLFSFEPCGKDSIFLCGSFSKESRRIVDSSFPLALFELGRCCGAPCSKDLVSTVEKGRGSHMIRLCERECLLAITWLVVG